MSRFRNLCRLGDADRWPPGWPQGGCEMADRHGPSAHDRGKLLDVATQPRHQPKPGCLASCASGRGALGMFAPANVAAYLYTPLALRGAAIGLLSLLRNEGGSVGVSLSQTFQERRDQFHVLRLGEYLDPFNAAASSFLARAEAFFVQQNGDPAASQQLAVQQLDNLRQQQASSLAYFDTFWMAAVLTFVVTFAVLFMKRSVAEKGARAGPE